jgi:putative inorganic carbon (HCO3(-)) transporter
MNLKVAGGPKGCICLVKFIKTPRDTILLYILCFILFIRPILDALRLDNFTLKNFLEGAAISEGLTLSYPIGAIVTVIGCFLLFDRKHKPLLNPVIVIFFINILINFFSIVLNPGKDGMVEMVRLLSVFSILVLAYTAVSDFDSLLTVVKSILAGSLIPGLVGIYQIFNNIGMMEYQKAWVRIYGTFTHPIPFGEHLAILLLVVTGALLRKQRIFSTANKTYLTLLAVFLSLLLFKTYSRSPWIAFAIGLCIILFVTNRKYFMYLTGALFMMLLAIPQIAAPVIARFSEKTSLSSVNTRLDLWQIGLKYWGESPLLGNGLGSGKAILIKEIGVNLGFHSSYIQALVETGVVGLLSLLVLQLAVLIYTFKIYQMMKYPLAKTMALCVFTIFLTIGIMSGLMANRLVSPIIAWYLWSLTGIVLKIPQFAEWRENRIDW